MNTKLTLNINQEVIVKAKIVARKRKTSVSRLVEGFLDKISVEKETSIVDLIIKNAPAKKTMRGYEKKILASRLKAKYGI